MLVYQPTKYLEFVSYCKQRRIYSRRYRDLKLLNQIGQLKNPDYLHALRGIQENLIELEIKHFDILHMRL